MQEILRYANDIVLLTTNMYFSFIEAVNLRVSSHCIDSTIKLMAIQLQTSYMCAVQIPEAKIKYIFVQ